MAGRICTRHVFCRIACLTAFLIFSLSLAFGSGKKDTTVPQQDHAQNVPTADGDAVSTSISGEVVTLSNIDVLIKQTKYSEALALLSEYIKYHPDNFDAAKTRIDKIMSVRHTYNFVENNLIDLAANNPSAADKNYQLVLQLEKIEQQPSVIHETIRTEIKNLTQFKACQQRFNEILAAAMNDVDKRQFSDAVEEFRKGDDGKQSAFEIYQEDFIAQNNPKSITLAVDKALATVDASITEYQAAQQELENAYTLFMNAVTQRRINEAQTAFFAVRIAFEKLAQIRNRTASAGWDIETVFEGLKKKNRDLTDASYLPFISKFILGLEKAPTSGIVGAMDTQWNTYLTAMKQAVYTAALEDSRKYALSLAVGTLFTYPALHEDGRIASGEMRQYARLGTSVNSLYDLVQKRDGTTALNDNSGYDRSMQYITTLSTESTNLFDQIRAISEETYHSESRTEPAERGAQSLTKDDAYAQTLIKAAEQFVTYGRNATTAKNARWLEEFKPKETIAQTAAETNASGGSADGAKQTPAAYTWDEAYTAYVTACTEIEKRTMDAARQTWVGLATYYAKNGTSIAQQYTARSSEIHKLLPPLQTDAMDNGVQRPTECLAQLDQFQKSCTADAKLLNDCRTQLEYGRTYSDSFVAQGQEIATAIQTLASLMADSTSLAERARTQQKNARLAKTEAEQRYQQARSALGRNEFDSAVDYLQRARAKYNESLSLEEDASLRKSSDENLVALGQEIAKAENEIVVRDVRKLKNDAKNAYYAGNFDQAETLIARAETRWAVTNVDKDEELENLKVLINTALSMKTGRVIPPTAPLYPEMSQILSIANQYYAEGQKLIQRGKRQDAEDILNQAKQKLNELKLVYPLNQEASLLTLRIDQLLDKNAFNTMFASKVETARVNYKAKDAETKQQAYSDLVDLYEINPDYPGLKNLIYQVEIELGIRQKPVDNSALVKASSLAREAERILASAGRDSTKLQQAKDRALQAVALNPNNDLAITVLDEIALKVGGQAAVVLSAEDEALYQKAVQELQKNNIIAANTIVQQLLNKSVNKRSAKILELQKKVQALL